MQNLVTTDLTTTSEIIAKNTNHSHKKTISLIRKHLTDLQEVGAVNFESSMVKRPQGGGVPTEIAILDDYAAMLLITHMRSIGKVKDFKRELVIEFKKMREYIRNQSKVALDNFQEKLLEQSNKLQAIEKREPRDEQSLAVIMGIPSYYVRPIHDLLERNNYLTRETFTQTYHVYSATPKLGKLCIGKKGNTLLYDGKIKELVKLLLDTESLFA